MALTTLGLIRFCPIGLPPTEPNWPVRQVRRQIADVIVGMAFRFVAVRFRVGRPDRDLPKFGTRPWDVILLMAVDNSLYSTISVIIRNRDSLLKSRGLFTPATREQYACSCAELAELGSLIIQTKCTTRLQKSQVLF